LLLSSVSQPSVVGDPQNIIKYSGNPLRHKMTGFGDQSIFSFVGRDPPFEKHGSKELKCLHLRII